MRFRPLYEPVVLLTGATSGIGLATARTLSQAGARLILVARGAEDCAAQAAELPQAVAAPADVADRDALRAAAQHGLDRLGRIDTWIKDAGVAIHGRVEEVPLEDQRRLFETNFWGSLNGMLEAVRLHRAGDGPAKIITLGSQQSDRAMIFQGPYSASKHAVKAVTDALRMEVDREGLPLSITLVKPGSVDTPYMEHARSYLGSEGTVNPPRVYAPEVVADGIPLGGEPLRDGRRARSRVRDGRGHGQSHPAPCRSLRDRGGGLVLPGRREAARLTTHARATGCPSCRKIPAGPGAAGEPVSDRSRRAFD